MTMPKSFTIITDTREKRPLKFFGVTTKRSALKTGDYSIEGHEHRVAIERKGLSDLLACVAKDRKRLNQQIDRLIEMESRAVVLEASIEKLECGNWRSKVSPNSVVGTIMSWKTRGLPVIYANSREHAAKYVYWFLRLYHERS